MCVTHYKRWFKYGDPHVTKKAFRVPPRCTVEGCTCRPVAKGLCQNHYALQRRNGTPVRTRVFTNEYIKDGYKYVRVGKRHYEPEHRIVMERFMKRHLTSAEQVHHIDGDTLNNSPSNLQIVTRSEHMRLHVPRKLNYAAVKDIRKQVAEGVSHPTLAKKYGASRTAILAVVHRRNWKHVA